MLHHSRAACLSSAGLDRALTPVRLPLGAMGTPLTPARLPLGALAGVTAATVGVVAHSLLQRRQGAALLTGRPQSRQWMEMVKACCMTMIVIAAAAAETTTGGGSRMVQTATALTEAVVMVPGLRSSQMAREGGNGTCHSVFLLLIDMQICQWPLTMVQLSARQAVRHITTRYKKLLIWETAHNSTAETEVDLM